MFDGMQANLDTVHAHFQRAIAPASLHPLSFKAWDGEFAINVHMRYFMDRKHAPSIKHELLPRDIDPHHHLDLVQGSNFIYCSDNQVEYCRKQMVEGVPQ